MKNSKLAFTSHNVRFDVKIGDVFMDIGTTLQFIPLEGFRYGWISAHVPNNKQWRTFSIQLQKSTYEEYYGKKPPLARGQENVFIYHLPNIVT